MALGMRFGRKPFARGPFGYGTGEAVSIGPIIEDLYSLELFDNTGNSMARLQYWGSGQNVIAMNRASTLTITYPFDDEHAADLVFPNQIALFDENKTRIGRYRIVRRVPDRTADGQKILTIECEDFLGQLAKEWITTYETVGATAVSTILGKLLGFQVASYGQRVTAGPVLGAIGTKTAELKVANETVLGAILRLHEATGGQFWLDGNLKLHWNYEIATRTGKQIRQGKNLSALKVTYDYSPIYTRVIAYGSTDGVGARITQTYNNSSAQSTYGIIPVAMSWPQVRDTTTLLKLATEAGRRLGTPKKIVECGVIDLSLSDDPLLDYSHESLTVGERVTLIDEDLGETLATRISRISRDLVAPMAVAIEVQNPADVPTTITDANIDAVAELAEDDDIIDVILELKKLDDLLKTGDPSFLLSDPMLQDIASAISQYMVDAIQADAAALTDLANSIESELGGTAAIVYAKVTGLQDDYIECNFWAAETATVGAAVNVAKPYILRRTPFDTVEITYLNGSVVSYVYDATYPQYRRVATAGSTPEDQTQFITPAYYAGEVITIATAVTGMVDGAAADIIYEDLNGCGRMWASVS